MTRNDWNSFTQKHPNATSFGAAVSARLGKGKSLDRNGKVLPTPYGLFCDWCRANLKDEWCGMPVKGGFVIKVATSGDAKLIADTFGAHKLERTAVGCGASYQTHYTDSHYGHLANSLGYALPLRN